VTPSAIKAVIYAVIAAIIVGGSIYFNKMGRDIERQRQYIEKQDQALAVMHQNQRALKDTVERQNDAIEETARVAVTAGELYEELSRRPVPVRYVTREAVSESIATGNCDLAALSAWDLLNKRGVIPCTGLTCPQPEQPDVSYWRQYYLDQSAASQPSSVNVSIHAIQPLSSLFDTPSRYPLPIQSSPLSQAPIYGWQVSIDRP